MPGLIHVGLQKTASTFLQKHVWPRVAERNPRVRYLGKFIESELPVSVSVDSALRHLWHALRAPGTEDERAAARPALRAAWSKLRADAHHDGIESVIISEEACTAQLLEIYVFKWMLTLFEQAGYAGDYMVMLRDPETMVKTLAPSNLSVFLTRGFIRTQADQVAVLEADEVVRRLTGWLDHEIAAARHGGVSLFTTTLD
jgi:hypothetical protein